jgi:hypothetical protein
MHDAIKNMRPTLSDTGIQADIRVTILDPTADIKNEIIKRIEGTTQQIFGKDRDTVAINFHSGKNVFIDYQPIVSDLFIFHIDKYLFH